MINIKDKLLAKSPKNKKYYLIAIDGRGGSGKTSLAELLADKLSDFTFLNGDDYFEPTPDELAWGAFNDTRFIEEVISPLSNAETKISYRPYDWHREPPIIEKPIGIKSGVCIERCFSFSFDLDYDLKIWVETPREVCFTRGLARESMPKERAIKVWQDIWQPQEDEFIREYKPQQNADIVINGTDSFDNQLN